MPLSKEQKDRVIKKYRVHDTDTGSAEVQIAILTEEIKQLTNHMKEHKHDYSSRLGLIRKVQERKRLLDYLRRENFESYEKLAKELKLKVAQQKIEQL
ncbi:MAG: 30S ribosomal protein S15 [Candidatus Parcubacteria bacterium]|nr:30S ribosomal protein S15 [Candidatus Parcubacteria bacterium]